jgi:hypothetical protein
MAPALPIAAVMDVCEDRGGCSAPQLHPSCRTLVLNAWHAHSDTRHSIGQDVHNRIYSAVVASWITGHTDTSCSAGSGTCWLLLLTLVLPVLLDILQGGYLSCATYDGKPGHPGTQILPKCCPFIHSFDSLVSL